MDSVLQRIRNVKSYAPLALPEHYDVVGGATPVADEPGQARRALGQEIARDLVWVRKGLYLLQLVFAVSLALAAVAILSATVWTLWGPFPRVPFNTWMVLASRPESFKWHLLTLVILALCVGWFRSGEHWLRARMNRITQDAWAATSSATEPQLASRTLEHAARGVRQDLPRPRRGEFRRQGRAVGCGARALAVSHCSLAPAAAVGTEAGRAVLPGRSRIDVVTPLTFARDRAKPLLRHDLCQPAILVLALHLPAM